MLKKCLFNRSISRRRQNEQRENNYQMFSFVIQGCCVAERKPFLGHRKEEKRLVTCACDRGFKDLVLKFDLKPNNAGIETLQRLSLGFVEFVCRKRKESSEFGVS